VPHNRTPKARPGLVSTALALAALLLPALLLANGGTLRFLGMLGPWEVAVFTDPTPPSPDSLDVSVLVTLPGNPRPVDGVNIVLRVETAEGGEGVLEARATREAADDPRYYAAKFRNVGAGEVGVTVSVRDTTGAGGDARFSIVTREPGLAENPAFLFIMALLPLLAVAWWMRRGRGSPG